MPPSVDVILPLYLTESSVGELVQRLNGVLQDFQLSIIAVDDQSPDQSAEIIQTVSTELNLPLTIAKHEQNRGQHQTVLTGLAQSRADISLVMDADLQDPPEMTVPLIEKLSPGSPGIAWALRKKYSAGWLEGISSRLFKLWVVRELGTDFATSFGMFFAITANSRRELLQLPSENAYLPAMLMVLRHPMHCIEYDRESVFRDSGYSLRKRLELASSARRWIKAHKTRLS